MQMAVSGQMASPSSLARRSIQTEMQLSGAVTAQPSLSRTALRIMKSPTATGTRSPLATVWAFSKGGACFSPASNARTIGAQPSLWQAIMRGRLPLGSQPMASSSANAFHMPINPVPPPVGYRMTSGSSQPSCSASSRPIVFLPSMRYGSLSVERSNQPIGSRPSPTRRPQSLIRPFTRYTRAPARCVSFRLMTGVSSGMNTNDSIPARDA